MPTFRAVERDLSGRIALVTGGSRGLGRAISIELAQKGAFVAVNYRRNGEDALRTLELIREAGSDGELFPADVGNADAVNSMFNELLRERRRIDILINNAGVTRDQPYLMMQEEDWRSVLQTDLHALFFCCKAALRPMCSARHGVIINIGSGSGISPRPGQVNYSSAKSAVIGFSRSLAREAARHNVRILVVAPGFTATDMSQALPSNIIQDSFRKIPLGRWGLPEEIASVVGFLASNHAGFINGQTVIVDGGRAAMEQDFYV
jgi:3-oxoacyl-[acyl-carrier protein] reductase